MCSTINIIGGACPQLDRFLRSALITLDSHDNRGDRDSSYDFRVVCIYLGHAPHQRAELVWASDCTLLTYILAIKSVRAVSHDLSKGHDVQAGGCLSDYAVSRYRVGR